jgi:nucleotide-binding universal stress UspA family protein
MSNVACPFTNILVPTDFSDASVAAIRLAVRMSQSSNARLTLMHIGVVPHVYATEWGMSGHTGPLFHQLAEEVNTEQRRRLEEIARAEVPEGMEVVTVIREGFAPEEVNQQVEDGGHDLVIMGTHGRTGLRRAILGSVTERVVRECTVPVMVTH